MEIFKKHKERLALAGLGIAFIIFIGGGIYLQKNNKKEKDLVPKAAPAHMELPTKQQAEGPKEENSAATIGTYFLKPSPDELLEQLLSMENLKADVIDEKISQMPVLWPAYFFTIQEGEDGRKSMVLDVSADGFGVVIESDLDPALFPRIQELKAGGKVWIGGKILAVDPAGTGRIYLNCEQFRIGDDGPFWQTASKKN